MRTGAKINLITETLRFNTQSDNIVGLFSENTNTKQRPKFVSLNNDGELVFWIASAQEMIISATDIYRCKVVAPGQSAASVSSGHWYGPALEITLVNGVTGRLILNAFRAGVACDKPGVYDIPVVNGWLAPGGARDAHYHDSFCPAGYMPDIVGYFAGFSTNRSKLSNVINAMQLKERFPDIFEEDGSLKGIYIFDGTKSTYYIPSPKRN